MYLDRPHSVLVTTHGPQYSYWHFAVQYTLAGSSPRGQEPTEPRRVLYSCWKFSQHYAVAGSSSRGQESCVPRPAAREQQRLLCALRCAQAGRLRIDERRLRARIDGVGQWIRHDEVPLLRLGVGVHRRVRQHRCPLGRLCICASKPHNSFTAAYYRGRLQFVCRTHLASYGRKSVE